MSVLQEQELKNKLIQDIPTSYLKKINVAYIIASKFAKKEFPNENIDVGDIATMILYQNKINLEIDEDDIEYDIIYEIISYKVRYYSRYDKQLKDLEKIWDQILIAPEDETEHKFTDFLSSKQGERHVILSKICHKFIREMIQIDKSDFNHLKLCLKIELENMMK